MKTMLKSDAAMLLLAEKDAHERSLVAASAMLAVLKGIASLTVAYENDPKEMAFQISLAATKAIAQAEAAGIK